MMKIRSTESTSDRITSGDEYRRIRHPVPARANRRSGKIGPDMKRRPEHSATPGRLRPIERFEPQEPVDPEWANYVEGVLAKQCYYCGFSNPSEALDCEQCGRSLEIVCPECGYANPNDPGYTNCLTCDALLPIEEYNGAVEANSESDPTNVVSFAIIIITLLGMAWFILQLSLIDDNSRPLIWLMLGPLALIALVTFLYVRNIILTNRNNNDV
jgi:hypothetical protein